MRKIYIKLATTGLITILLLTGCSKEGVDSPPPKEKVAVMMRGGLAGLARNTRGIINPQNSPGVEGLPPQQLDINIITVNYTTSEPSKISGQPDLEAWSGQTADFTRGFFGENTDFTTGNNGNPIIPIADREDQIPNSGRIEYTDESGTSVQKVFYDENGEYYFVRLFYPYDEEDTEFTSSTAGLGASIIFRNVDGSQDILCSNLGWGNTLNPLITTAIDLDEDGDTDDGEDLEGEIVFSHMLSLFRIWIKPDNKAVVGDDGSTTAQYGKIKNVQVARQPSTLIADAMRGVIQPLNDPFETNYKANDFPANGLYLSWDINEEPEGQAITNSAGYVIVYPGLNEYRIEVETERHMWVHGELSFTSPPKPGKIYDITITMKEAYEIEVIETKVADWWMDHVFN
ncbi:fimbrillin family protein [Parabacteroides sp. PF5-9]|uniref:fimbrillin family protein n=1 Tax=Parabacteroides sp. PF5-9 TaxID=1742404 RepID=UPI002473F97B|nr:fimbrillin family protein [Parabacteroides sp. PF5-9]MDH6357166.1 hypothetical protein [Parabacteroides sp. PF5-9]